MLQQIVLAGRLRKRKGKDVFDTTTKHAMTTTDECGDWRFLLPADEKVSELTSSGLNLDWCQPTVQADKGAAKGNDQTRSG